APDRTDHRTSCRAGVQFRGEPVRRRRPRDGKADRRRRRQEMSIISEVAPQTREAPAGESTAVWRRRRNAARELESELRRQLKGEVRFDTGSRALYATDLSIYRHIPIGVVIPQDVDDVIAAVACCRAHDAPILARGCGTSLSGQCCNVAVVIDFSKHM